MKFEQECSSRWKLYIASQIPVLRIQMQSN
jgi:hypothetical protein